MMGRGEGKAVLLFFDLESGAPDIWSPDRLLDLSWVQSCAVLHTGRPSIDPVLMIRMLLVGYIFAIRSERQICSEVQVNLAYSWFCKLTIEDGIPDHSVFCRARHERLRESNALRRVFEGVVATCIAAGLVGGELFGREPDGCGQERVPEISLVGRRRSSVRRDLALDAPNMGDTKWIRGGRRKPQRVRDRSQRHGFGATFLLDATTSTTRWRAPPSLRSPDHVERVRRFGLRPGLAGNATAR